MKILVAGHLCLDVIHAADGTEIRSYGGIYYAVTTLGLLAAPGDRILPVFGVGADDHEALIADLAAFPAVDTSGVYRFPGPTNQVHLFYGNGRTECSSHIAPPIPFERLRPFLNVDGILLNMISGFDFTLETLDQIRMAIRPHGIPVHFDYHSLTLGIDAEHKRFRRPLDDWRRWAFMIDTVQLNEDEIAGLPRDRMTEQQTAGHLLTLGPKGVIVTRGDRGATLYQNERKRVIRTDVPGHAVDRAVDATGCGDVFGAAFLMSMLRGKDMHQAMVSSNTLAAAKARTPGSTRMAQLEVHV